MSSPAKTLRLPASLCVALLGGAAAEGCPGGAPPVDATPFEGGTCTVTPPPGRVCVTVCNEQNPPPQPADPFACETYCDRPDSRTPVTLCYFADGGTNYPCGLYLRADGGYVNLC